MRSSIDDFMYFHIESIGLCALNRWRDLSLISNAAFFRLSISALFHNSILRRTGLSLLAQLCVCICTASSSPKPGMVIHLLTSDGLFVMNTSRIYSPRVGSFTICLRWHSLTISIVHWFMAFRYWCPFTLFEFQSTSGRLRSPPISMAAFLFEVTILSICLHKFSVYLILLLGGLYMEPIKTMLLFSRFVLMNADSVSDDSISQKSMLFLLRGEHHHVHQLYPLYYLVRVRKYFTWFYITFKPCFCGDYYIWGYGIKKSE